MAGNVNVKLLLKVEDAKAKRELTVRYLGKREAFVTVEPNGHSDSRYYRRP